MHHWESTNPLINKENCRISATILLDKSTHARITRRTAIDNKYIDKWQQYYESKSLYCIVSLLKKKIPKCWKEISIEKINIIRRGEHIDKLKYLFLQQPKILNAYKDPYFLTKMERKYSFNTLTGISIFNDDLFLYMLNK